MGNKERRSKSDSEPENSGEAYQRDLDQLYGAPDKEDKDQQKPGDKK